jgi:hypothetical protein
LQELEQVLREYDKAEVMEAFLGKEHPSTALVAKVVVH